MEKLLILELQALGFTKPTERERKDIVTRLRPLTQGMDFHTEKGWQALLDLVERRAPTL